MTLIERIKSGEKVNLSWEVDSLKIQAIRTALELTRGNRAHAARILGMKRSTMISFIEIYRQQVGDYRLT